MVTKFSQTWLRELILPQERASMMGRNMVATMGIDSKATSSRSGRNSRIGYITKSNANSQERIFLAGIQYTYDPTKLPPKPQFSI